MLKLKFSSAASLSNQQETIDLDLPFQTFSQWDPRTDVFRTMEVFYGRTTTKKMIQKLFLFGRNTLFIG